MTTLPRYLLLLCSGVLFHGLLQAQPPDGQVNIIFIMADDLGYGDLGCYGQENISTPHIDRLAAEGVRFTQFYAGSPVCAPSRAVLMTGQHTGHTTVRGNTGTGGVVGLGGRSGRIPLADHDTTIAEILQSIGYTTAMIGKWGLGEPGTTGLPHLQGFDYFYGFLNQRRAHNYFPNYLWDNQQRDSFPQNAESQYAYAHDIFTERALDFIKAHQDSAFLLYLPYTVPHDKYQIPSLFPYADSSSWGHDAQVHAAMITRLDRDVGKIMHLLSALHLRKHTMIFFCSDNGAAQRWEGVFDSSGSLRGRKRDLYEGGIRSPLIVSQPGVLPRTKICAQPAHFMDILPTLCDLAGLSKTSHADGISILPFLRDPDLSLTDRTLYWEFYERGFQQAIRWKNWKAIRLHTDQSWELYNLTNDPIEAKDVALDHPDVLLHIEKVAHKSYVPSAHFFRD